ncbi:MAG TPA: hypothetical protein VJL81_06010 [Solirubrobacterales bacterium]|nr:hypothetical protein [Solirubrobacterales bacterium]
MNMHAPTTTIKSLLAAAALAGVVLLALLALSGSPAAAAKPKSYECQHPLITGQEAVNPKGISPKAACKVVRELGAFLSTDQHIEELYECKGATPMKPGKPVLLMDEFKGWKLKLYGNGYTFIMSKPGQSFRVTGQDFPVNCS